MSQPWEARFWAKVNKQGPGGCWVWTGHTWHGYGGLWVNGKNVLTHKISYELFHGEVPKGLCLDHLCRNRACCNPDHLEVVTLGENVLRGVAPAALNSRKTHCPRGHEFTKENTIIGTNRGNRPSRYCKTCKRELQRIRRAAAAGSNLLIQSFTEAP